MPLIWTGPENIRNDPRNSKMSTATATEFLSFEDKDLELANNCNNRSSYAFFDENFNLDHVPSDSSSTSNGSRCFEADVALPSMDDPFIDNIPFNAFSGFNQPQQFWRASPWNHDKNVSVPTAQGLVRSLRMDGVAISSTELLSLENKHHGPQSLMISPPSPPETPSSTPSRKSGEKRHTSAISTSRRSSRIGKSASQAAESSPATMQRLSHYATPNGESPFNEWTERFQQFSLQLPHNPLPLSPPSSAAPEYEQRQLFRRGSELPTTQQNINIHPAPNLQHSGTSVSDEVTFAGSPSLLSKNWPENISQLADACFQDINVDFSSQNYANLPSQFATQGLTVSNKDEDVVSQRNFFDPLLPPFEPESFFSDKNIEDDGDFFSYSSTVSNLTTSHQNSDIKQAEPSSSSITSHEFLHPPSRSRPSAKTRTMSKAKATEKAKSSSFLVYTMKDKDTILTGVAPSGSSKTKAKRDREAMEKKGKLVSYVASKGVPMEDIEKDLGNDFV